MSYPYPPYFASVIQALDAQTGEVLWQAKGGWEIRYAEACDLLCSPSGVFRGADGSRVRDTADSLVIDDKLISGGPDQVAVFDARVMSSDLILARRIAGHPAMKLGVYKGTGPRQGSPESSPLIWRHVPFELDEEVPRLWHDRRTPPTGRRFGRSRSTDRCARRCPRIRFFPIALPSLRPKHPSSAVGRNRSRAVDR